ncbi:hypothetical protein [Spirillospora sp. CA-294931]|uniref:hypothetical protein n=1 Tax=Spirillospora sp. CA-294931 TaxID=3240042 RepID=UPI003D8A3AEE
MDGNWRLVWSPEPRRDGLAAFTRIEDDRAGSHPGEPHIRALGTMYRFDIHYPQDVDTYPDRQRHEVKDMRIDGAERRAAEGESWRFTWSWYLPKALRATTSFTHVHQFFASGPAGGPLMMTSLRRRGGRDLIELNAHHAGVVVGATGLEPLRSRWIDIELEVLFATRGRVHWRVSADGVTAIDVERDGLDTWLGTQGISPKWGIYRSLKDAQRLGDAHLLLRDVKAFLRE